MAKATKGEVFLMKDKTVDELRGTILKVNNSLWISVLYVDYITGGVWWTCSMEKWVDVEGEEITETPKMLPVFRPNHNHWLGSMDEVTVLATDIMPADIKNLSGEAKKVLTEFYG